MLLVVVNVSTPTPNEVALADAVSWPVNAVNSARQMSLVRLPYSEYVAGQLSASTLSTVGGSGARLGDLVVAANAPAATGDAPALAQELADHPGEQVFGVRLSSGANATICSALSSCSFSHDATVEPVTKAGVEADWTQRGFDLPMGGRFLINAATGHAFLEPHGSVDAAISECLSVSPQLNTSEADRNGSFGPGFESSVEQIQLSGTANYGNLLRGPTGWTKRVAGPLSRIQSRTGYSVGLTATDVGVTYGDGTVYRVALPSGVGNVRQPSGCIATGDSAYVTYGRTNGVLDAIQDSNSETVLALGRTPAGDIASVSGGVQTIAYQYEGPGGRLSSASFDEDLGSVSIEWDTIGGVTLPVELDYSNGATLEISYSGGAVATVSSATYSSLSASPRTFQFSGTGTARVLTDGTDSWPTVGATSGRLIGPDSTPPSLRAADDVAPKLHYSPTLQKVVLDGVVSDGLSGVRTVAAITSGGTSIASISPNCFQRSQCPQEEDMSMNLLSTTVALSDGQSVTIRMTDAAGNVVDAPASVKVDTAAPVAVQEVMVASTSGTGTTQAPTVTWELPDNEPLGTTRTVRWRKNTGTWQNAISALDGQLTTSATFAVGDTIDLEFSSNSSLGGAGAPQTVTLPATEITDLVPPSNARAEWRGSPDDYLDLTLQYSGLYAGNAATDIAVSYSSQRLTAASDGEWLVTHVGTNTTNEQGKIRIPDLLPGRPVAVTVDDVEYTIPYAAGSSAQTIQIPTPEPADDIDPVGGPLFIGGMNSKETDFCSHVTALGRLELCAQYSLLANTAKKVTPGYWDNYGGDSHKQNAHKHAYWNGLLERSRLGQPATGWRLQGKWTLKDLVKLMFKHENETWFSEDPIVQRTSVMDFHNNKSGRGFGRKRVRWSRNHFCRGVTQWSRKATYGRFIGGTAWWDFGYYPKLGRLVYYNKQARPIKAAEGTGCSQIGSRSSVPEGNRTYEEPYITS